MSIPVVDLAKFIKGDTVERQSFVQQLGKAYEEVGFVAVKNHGIPDDLIAHLYEKVQQFFSLPLKHKKKYEIPDLAGQRGYTSFGREHAKGSETQDLKEFFQFGQVVGDGDSIKHIYPDNVSVLEIKDFNETTRQAFINFETSGRFLLQAIALYLGLNEHYFDSHIHNGNSI